MLFICQKETAEKTQCPANSKRNDSGAGYLTTERDVTSFHEAGELHLAVDWENLDEGNGISQTFENHRATWHKSCRDKFNKTKEDRLLKRKLSGESHDQRSSKRTRRLFPDSKQSPVCFFCEALATDGGLREACTMDIDSRVRSVAHELCDVNLLSKLSTVRWRPLGPNITPVVWQHCTTAHDGIVREDYHKKTTNLCTIVLRWRN